MGMTIEEQIKALEYLKKCGIFPFSDTRTGIVITDKYVDGAIDTMRKYQQIRDKVSTIYVGYRHGYEVMADVMEILREVEDGNNK